MVRNLELLVMVCIADRFIMLTPMDLMITGINVISGGLPFGSEGQSESWSG